MQNAEIQEIKNCKSFVIWYNRQNDLYFVISMSIGIFEKKQRRLLSWQKSRKIETM